MAGRVLQAAASAVLALVVAGAPGVGPLPANAGQARAEVHGDRGGGPPEGRGPGAAGHGGGHDPGDGGSHSDGHSDDHGDDAGHGNAGRGKGQGVGGAGQQGSGAGARGGEGGRGGGGQDRADRSGGRPPWAQEGIPEIELGRLNVARSPARVLDRAYTEALASLTGETLGFYNQSLDQMIAELSLNWDNVTFIDSPLQNLALLRDALDGESGLRSVGVQTPTETLMAAFLGTASDKTIPITSDTALAVSTILDRPLSPPDAAALAADAERIRIAILAGHG
jgi:hypothetical protein